MSEPLRVGRIVALNMYPIYHHLEGQDGETFAFTDGLPTRLNRALLDGELDVSAMSSIEYARHADELTLLPVASISAAGAVDSIQVFSRVPFEDLRTVAVTPHSATSVALLRILAGPDVAFVALEGDPRAALNEVDGVLLIADEALHGLADGIAPVTTDLGARWAELTGLPMVYAVWASRSEIGLRRSELISRVLTDAQVAFAEDPGRVVAAAAARFPFPADYIERYFRRLSYGFGPEERAGFGRFVELARVHGELPTTSGDARQVGGATNLY